MKEKGIAEEIVALTCGPAKSEVMYVFKSCKHAEIVKFFVGDEIYFYINFDWLQNCYISCK